MMKRVLALFLILTFLLAGLSLTQEGRAQGTKWTIMVYMAADNNLEDMSVHDFEEMSQIGSTENVKIVVQYDRKPGEPDANPDWTTTKRFLVQEGDEPLPSYQIEDIGEAAMDDPNTLGRLHPWFMGGEFLPAYLPGEVEIARMCDLFHCVPAMTGKMELVFKGEQEGVVTVAQRLHPKGGLGPGEPAGPGT